ncbi:unnamed protein product [Malus baccata var. baccata]
MDSTLLRFASLLLLSLTSSANPNSDYNSLVYTKCANRTFATPPTKLQFYRHAEAGLDNNEAGISGLFQCRQDLSNEECHSCVNTLRNLSNTLCQESVSARVQLHGCYELDGVDSEPFNDRLMHKTCGEDLANGVAASEVADCGGFCKTGYEAVQLMAQCSGGLGGCECGECVGRAVQIAEEECGGAVSGQIYLEDCLLSYSYHPDKIPDEHPHDPEKHRDGDGGNGGNESVAIVVGGAAALCFAFIFFLFVKSWSKKEDD